MKDRNLGYIVLILLLLAFVAISVYLALNGMAPIDNRTIAFKQIGGLHLEDPVEIRGVQVGSIFSIQPTDSFVYVQICSPHRIDIHQGYRIESANIGIMDDRYVNIDPGDPALPLINNKELLKGDFVVGPSEALGALSKLKQTIDWLQKLILELKEGGSGKSSLIHQFKVVMKGLDAATSSMVVVASDLDVKIGKSADSLAALLSQTADFSSSLSQQAPGYLDTLDHALSRIDQLAAKIDTLVGSSQKLVTNLQDKKNILWGTSIADLRKQILDVQNMLAEIKLTGLQLPVKPR